MVELPFHRSSFFFTLNLVAFLWTSFSLSDFFLVGCTFYKCVSICCFFIPVIFRFFLSLLNINFCYSDTTTDCSVILLWMQSQSFAIHFFFSLSLSSFVKSFLYSFLFVSSIFFNVSSCALLVAFQPLTVPDSTH